MRWGNDDRTIRQGEHSTSNTRETADTATNKLAVAHQLDGGRGAFVDPAEVAQQEKPAQASEREAPAGQANLRLISATCSNTNTDGTTAYLVIKRVLSGIIIAVVSEISKHSPAFDELLLFK